MSSNIQKTVRPGNGAHRPIADTHGREFPTRIDIPHARREPLEALLNARLADAFDLHSQTKQAHWNVKGPNFYQLHILFDDLAQKIEGHADLFAERVTALGGTARGTARMASAGSSVAEFPQDLHTDMAFVKALADRYAAYGKLLRLATAECEELADPGTADIFTEASRAADQALYLLEAHLQVRPAR